MSSGKVTPSGLDRVNRNDLSILAPRYPTIGDSMRGQLDVISFAHGYLTSRIRTALPADKVAAALALEVLMVSVYRSPLLGAVQWAGDEHASGNAAWKVTIDVSADENERPVVFLFDGRFMRWRNVDIDLLMVPVSDWPYVQGGMAV